MYGITHVVVVVGTDLLLYPGVLRVAVRVDRGLGVVAVGGKPEEEVLLDLLQDLGIITLARLNYIPILLQSAYGQLMSLFPLAQLPVLHGRATIQLATK